MLFRSYWKQYVRSLPLGAVKPYALVGRAAQASVPAVASSPAVQQIESAPVDCGDKRRVRLLFIDPMPPGTVPGIAVSAKPTAARESIICLPTVR